MTEKIFFSYSRSDSTFVLQLAQDLRSEGVDLWLDQLDIKPGNRWDASIESALDSAKAMIIVLSPTSVDSNNVMDEVSFALESNKQVIPVLLSDCKIPFRLKRLQHIDFTVNYAAGLNLLLEVLGHGRSIPKEEITSVPSQTLPVSSTPSKDVPKVERVESFVKMPEQKPEAASSNFDWSVSESSKRKEALTYDGKKKSLQKYLFISGGVLLVILLFWVIIRPESSKSSITANVDSASMAKTSKRDIIVNDSSIRRLILGRWIYKTDTNYINEYHEDGTVYSFKKRANENAKDILLENADRTNFLKGIWKVSKDSVRETYIIDKETNEIFQNTSIIVRINENEVTMFNTDDVRKEQTVLKRIR